MGHHSKLRLHPSPAMISKKLSQGHSQARGFLWFKDSVKKPKKVGVARRPKTVEAKMRLGLEEQKRTLK